MVDVFRFPLLGATLPLTNIFEVLGAVNIWLFRWCSTASEPSPSKETARRLMWLPLFVPMCHVARTPLTLTATSSVIDLFFTAWESVKSAWASRANVLTRVLHSLQCQHSQHGLQLVNGTNYDKEIWQSSPKLNTMDPLTWTDFGLIFCYFKCCCALNLQ